MRYLLSIILIGVLTGCSDNQSKENSRPTDFIYGEQVEIKAGFYKGFKCTIIAEYEDSIFCKVNFTPEDASEGAVMLKENWQTNQNFEKSNVKRLE